MGGRIASMIADELFAAGKIRGLLCLGYPFHPLAKPEKVRTEHLLDLKTPALIVQGTRDAFGAREEVVGYALSPMARDPMVGGRRPRFQATQENLALLDGRPSHGPGPGGLRLG